MVRVVGGIFLAPSVSPPLADCGTFITFLVRHLTLIGLLEEGKINSPYATVGFQGAFLFIFIAFPHFLDFHRGVDA